MYIRPVLITRNHLKAAEMQALLGMAADMMTPEQLDLDPTEFGAHMVVEAFVTLQRPCIREQSCMKIRGIHYTEPNERVFRDYIGETVTVAGHVSWCTEENEAHTLYYEQTGTLVDRVSIRSPLSFGWDDWFIPFGYDKTVTELGVQKTFASFRAKPFAYVGASILGRECTAITETHLTVLAEHSPEKFRADCTALGVKAIIIDLESDRPTNGRFQFQTSQWRSHTHQQAVDNASELAQALHKLGWTVVRRKLEVKPCVREGFVNCPEFDDQVAAFPQGNYFEFHVKFELPLLVGEEDFRLHKLATAHDGHLSSNGFKKFKDVRHKFVTFRMYGMGRKRAYERVDGFVENAVENGHKVVQVQREYATFDTDARYDAGWVEPA